MEFRFRSFKEPEFDSLLHSLRHAHNLGAGHVVTYNRDGDLTTAIIEDNVIAQFSEEELAELTTVR